LDKRGTASRTGQKAQCAQQERAQGCAGDSCAFVPHQWCGPDPGGWDGSIAGANDHDGSGQQCLGEVPDRQELLFVAGPGAQARHHRGQGVEQSHAQDQEPRRAGLSHTCTALRLVQCRCGGASGEEGRLSIWSHVSEVACQAGTSPGDGGHSPRDSAGGVQDVEVQGRVRSVERE